MTLPDRLTHSLEVVVARQWHAPKTDEDVAEAIALAHDLGHPPFGHAGETALNEMMADYGGFDHNEQSLCGNCVRRTICSFRWAQPYL